MLGLFHSSSRHKLPSHKGLTLTILANGGSEKFHWYLLAPLSVFGVVIVDKGGKRGFHRERRAPPISQGVTTKRNKRSRCKVVKLTVILLNGFSELAARRAVCFIRCHCRPCVQRKVPRKPAVHSTLSIKLAHIILPFGMIRCPLSRQNSTENYR